MSGTQALPVPYFHLVFTLPEELNTVCLNYPKESYGLFGSKKHIICGMIAVLHTWGQNLCLYPHLHCIVPGGGVDKKGIWKYIRTDGKYLFPVKALSKVFRAKYVSLLRKSSILSSEASNASFKGRLESLFSKSWVVYAKRPFAHPSHVVEYLGRYTHKIAISNNRLVSYRDGKVRFSYKDYRQGACKKEMELTDTEFIRRFALHIPPSKFMRIRHYGILSSTSKKETIPSIRQQFGTPEINFIDLRKLHSFGFGVCPCCGSLSMVTVQTLPSRSPPKARPVALPVETERQNVSS